MSPAFNHTVVQAVQRISLAMVTTVTDKSNKLETADHSAQLLTVFHTKYVWTLLWVPARESSSVINKVSNKVKVIGSK